MREQRQTKEISAEQFNMISNIEISSLTNWDIVKDSIFPRMVDVRETTYIENKPHTYAADIPVIYYIELANGDQLVSSPVTDNLINQWNVTIDEIDRAARQNIDPQIMTLTGAIASLTDSTEEYAGLPVYVLTNRKKVFGAASVLDKPSMKRLMKYLDTDTLAIIPSSIHEVLVMPFDPDTIEDQNDMIKTVNETALEEDDILSDHLYKYDIENGLTIA